MIPGVTEVDLYAIQELPHLTGADTTTRIPAGNVGSLLAGYLDLGEVGNIIAMLVGQGSIFPDRVYMPYNTMPSGSSISMDGTQIIDPYLDGKVYSVHRRGVELMIKGSEWDNDIPGGVIHLLQAGDIYNDQDVITVQFQPQISNIISSPDAIAKMTSGVQVVTADTVLGPSTFRRLIVLASATTSLTVTLSAAYPENIGLFISSSYSSGLQKQATILAGSGMGFAVNGAITDRVFIGQDETIQVIRSGAIWLVLQRSSNWERVGHVSAGYMVGPNQLVCEGQLISRADYPRITDWLTRFAAAGGTVLNEASWATNQTLWGVGDGSTTLRVPNLRGYFMRYLDLGAGIDIDRENSGIDDRAGSAQAGAVESHNHIGPDPNFNKLVRAANQGGPSNTTAAIFTGSINDDRPRADHTGSIVAYGGTETRPINVALLPIMNI